MHRRAISILLALLLSTPSLAQETRRQYLSGHGIDDAIPWEFFCSAGRRSGQWTTLPVPSCWDAAGFGTLTYGRPPKGTPHSSEQGQYRNHFQVPADWSSQTIFLVFEGSMTDTQAFINGQPAGPKHQGAFYRFKYNVTDLVKLGADNLLEVTVDKESANPSVNNAERRGDYWNFGGIFRPVYLEARPRQHIDRLAIDARADGSFSMDVFTSPSTTATKVHAQIVDSDGHPVGPAFSDALSDNHATLRTKNPYFQTWTAETPTLYQVDVTLRSDDKPLHHVRQRFGFRTIEVRPGDGFYVNNQRILLKGTDRHTFWPDTGRASDPRISRDDISLIKDMNNNAVRMSHYPPDEHFLDLCDELGLYVLDELAGWHQSYDQPTAHRLVQQMVTRDVNHPSILFWDNGNEGGWNTSVDDDFAKWDPQHRHVLHPWSPFRGINTKHYPVYDLLTKLVDGPDVYFPTEFQHALFDGGGGAGLDDYWTAIRHGKSAAGGFIWAFVDEAVKREDGKLDTAGNQAPDGVLGPYRQKEASYYAIKQTWSLIVLTRDPAGQITVENRYDFTNASKCTFTWMVGNFTQPSDKRPGFANGTIGKANVPSIPPHSSGVLKLDLPPKAADSDALAIDVTDPTGRELGAWVWLLRDPKITQRTPAPAKIDAKEDADSITLTAADLTITLSKQTGRLTAARRGDHSFPLTNGPRVLAGDATLTQIEHHPDGPDQLVTATYSGNLESVQYRLTPTGTLDLTYSYNFTGPTDFLGIGFDLPDADLKSIKWLGNGPYRVWKNRLQGGSLNVWQNTYNKTQTGYTDWIYPEFKGFYSQVRWMQLQTTAGPILLTLDDPSLFVQILRPDFPANPKPHSPTTAATHPVNQGATLSANAWANCPDAGLAILHAIPPIGTKFNIPQQLGPQSQQTQAAGTYRAHVRLAFPTAPER